MPLLFVKHLFYKALKYEVIESVEAMPLRKALVYNPLKYEVLIESILLLFYRMTS